MGDVKKKDIRLINKVYQHSKRFLLRWPLSDADVRRHQYHIEELNSAIDSGILTVVKKQLFPSVEVDVLVVHEDYEQYVSANTLHFLDIKKDEKQRRSEKDQRSGYVDHYKYERNPHMGWKLTNDGGKYICTECMALNRPCEHGKEFIKKLPPEARVPRVNASKTRWKEFKKRFLKN